MKKTLFVIFSVLVLTNCNQSAEPVNKLSLLTSHKWQLVSESGLNLPAESLNDNIIELKKNGAFVYYENKLAKGVFTENKWQLSPDEKKLIEILPDNKKIESEIVELSANTLKVRYTEPDGLKGMNTVEETYVKFVR